jgi:hypothetical protein
MSIGLSDMVNLPLCAGLAATRAFPLALTFLKPAAAVALLIYLQITFPHTWVGSLGLERLERFGKRIANRKRLCVFLVGLSLLVIRSALIPVSGIPLPRYHDEYSYLLAGDTFAHGRLANPPHPMWIHFETFHVIWNPTYMSMYPPGQGLVLAAGEVLGCAWIGQLLAAALMCAAICWMLQGWIPPRWALLGGVLTLPRLGLLSYWTNGYWCACLPALGGALVLGALPRIQQHLRRRDAVIFAVIFAVIMAIGLFLLANSRPYEGFLLSLGVAIALLAWMFGKDGPTLRFSLARIVLPVVLTLAPLAAWTGYYYYRVTGSPLRMAYEINRETYAMGRYFIWQTPWAQKTYNHPRMQALYERELSETEEYQSLRGFVGRNRIKLYYFWQVYLVPPLPFVLIALPWAVRDRKLRVPWLISGIFLAGLVVETWGLPHYSAPATALVFLILMQCMRRLRLFRWRTRPVGLAFVRAVSVIYIGAVVLRVAFAVAHIHPEHEWQHGDMDRESIVQHLKAIPGQHVVLVNYSPDFDLDREWVYNLADIDGSKIVWARDMGPEKNRELLAYYRGRVFWMVHAGSAPRLEPYGESATGASY